MECITPVPNIIITGDFNLPHISWPLYLPSQGASREEKQMINVLKTFIDELFLEQYVNTPTHIQGNILDLLFTNNSDIVHSLQITKTLQSTTDHHVIEILSNLTLSTSHTPDKCNPDSNPTFKTLNFHSDKISWDEITTELSNIDWNLKLVNHTAEQMLQTIYDVLLEVSVNHVPPKILKNTKSRIPKDRRSLMRRRNRINKRNLTL